MAFRQIHSVSVLIAIFRRSLKAAMAEVSRPYFFISKGISLGATLPIWRWLTCAYAVGSQAGSCSTYRMYGALPGATGHVVRYASRYRSITPSTKPLTDAQMAV